MRIIIIVIIINTRARFRNECLHEKYCLARRYTARTIYIYI